ncbi:TetR/AcrR family transcriptional regulator [Nocardioides cynanchi]|uniref:TetR/AcrR family transcriptional regulator n=1 Tax=Nocardioides cynanchi TaxID=2558918 RepID=UPI001245FDB6|nr:TetR/AcrR family transcriptional regulator [Nocardioides cynanchi]
MGRPRTHDRQVADALVDAAEQLADSGGVGAVSVRAVAERTGTTTRAVYSVFGSKAGLVAALGTRMFELLGDGVAELPETDDPVADLVEAGVGVFRRLSVTRPALFDIGVRHTAVDPDTVGEFVPAARDAWGSLEARFQRLQDAGLLPGRTVTVASRQFDAMCEGLAAMERRGSMETSGAEDVWRDALQTLLDGMTRHRD